MVPSILPAKPCILVPCCRNWCREHDKQKFWTLSNGRLTCNNYSLPFWTQKKGSPPLLFKSPLQFTHKSSHRFSPSFQLSPPLTHLNPPQLWVSFEFVSAIWVWGSVMALVVVLSLPLILFAILLGFGCYFLGRAKGRQDMRTGVGAQIYGAPVPPPAVREAGVLSPEHLKKEGPEAVWVDLVKRRDCGVQCAVNLHSFGFNFICFIVWNHC